MTGGGLPEHNTRVNKLPKSTYTVRIRFRLTDRQTYQRPKCS